jgi:hypothetical protein
MYTLYIQVNPENIKEWDKLCCAVTSTCLFSTKVSGFGHIFKTDPAIPLLLGTAVQLRQLGVFAPRP